MGDEAVAGGKGGSHQCTFGVADDEDSIGIYAWKLASGLETGRKSFEPARESVLLAELVARTICRAGACGLRPERYAGLFHDE